MKVNKKVKTRDLWIPASWRMSGCGFHKNKKKALPRDAKHKEKY